jgi:superfamily II DNA or RNA helicase
MDIITLYNKYIYDRYNSLLKSGKEEFDNKDLSKIFEYYTAIKLSEQYGQLFYEYNDIDPNFKELNQMSKNDSGVDLCNLVDTIVQCKLRKQYLNWGECSTFFASRNIFNDETNSVEIRWKNLLIARNSECKLSCNLSIKNKLFTDITYDRDELLEFLQKIEPKEECIILKEEYIKPKEEIILRDYQIECIKLIKNSDKNIIIQLPTGCGKNVIITQYISQKLYSKCDIANEENTKPLKFLILVPKIILMEQIRDEFGGLNLPDILDSIQLIGDGNTEFNEDKLITICVYNSIDKISNFAQFEKIFIDEAHHIIKPEIYYNEEDTNSEYNSDLDSKYSEYDSDLDSEYSADDNLFDEDLDENLENEDLENEDLENKDDEKEECNLDEIKEKPKEENYLSKIRKLKKYNNNVFLSATIDKIDEYEYYSKDIRDMINEGYLCDYNIHIPIFSGNIDTIKSDTNVCKHLIQNYSNIIIYCNTKKEGIEINKIMNELLPLCSKYIDCDTKRNDRNTILEKFKSGEIPFLVNVKILVEGFNAPITKGVCFLHMPSSKTAIIQIIGRALRLHDYKTIANIILPFSNTEDEKDINNFLRILANNDYRIKQSYDKKKLGGYISLNKVEPDCSEELDNNDNCEFRFTMIYDNIGKLINSEEIWMQKLEEVKAYIDEFGHRPNKKSKNIEEKIIGIWISNQNGYYHKKISIMKNKNIREIWKKFINDYRQYFLSNEEQWLKKLENLQNYLNTHNKFPTRVKNLYSWVNTNKNNYKHNICIMKDNLYIKKLWDNFIITNSNYINYLIPEIELFKININKCKIYIDNFNIRPSSNNNDINIKKLGIFLINTNKRYKDNVMDIEKKQIYENFINDEKYKNILLSSLEQFIININDCKMYIDNLNTRPSSEDTNINTKKLGVFLLNNNKRYKDNTMDIERKQIYENFINDEKYRYYFMDDEQKWIYALNLLKNYFNTFNKKPNLSKSDKKSSFLYRWLNNQITAYKQKSRIMKNEKNYKLWEEFINNEKYKQYFINEEQKWINNLECLKTHYDQFNDNPKKNSYLNKWISHQIQNYKHNKDRLSNANYRKLWEEFINDKKYSQYFN